MSTRPLVRLLAVVLVPLAIACEGEAPVTDSTHPANRLAAEKSPYLLQHAHNPVDWYPWGEEAFARAREEDKPIFLSVGYSTCHWCHVMAHESFEDTAVAAVLNEHFVSIKVDREERPDVDALYMGAVQALTGQGGWPMSVWLTPEGRPFYAGTYFPPSDLPGRPGFRGLLLAIHDAWENRREQVTEQSGEITRYLAERARGSTGPEREVDAALLDEARNRLAARFDSVRGGFGGAPKFPSPHQLSFLLRRYARTGDAETLHMVRTTLDAMAAGGIHDHLAGGFHRYSTDARWLAPHFEKMLYDQAGIAIAYLEAWQVTGDPVYEAVTRDVLDYVLGYLTHPDGGFLSAEDADSEGEEGTFYVWQPAGIDAVLGDDGERFRAVYDVSPAGNWEGKSILHTADPQPILDTSLRPLRERLRVARDERVRPHLDDKVITAWNGFMIEAFARAGAALGEPRYVAAARRAADFVDARLVRDDGRLLRHWRGGAADVPAFQEDHAFLARGRLALYEATFDPRDLARAADLAREMLARFALPGGGFAFQGSDQDSLVAPVVEAYDGAMPSGNSAAAVVLLRLGHLLADRDLETAGWTTIRVFADALEESPTAYLEMLSALDFALGPRGEVVIAGTGPEADALLAAARAGFRPNTVLLRNTGPGDARDLVPYLAAQGEVDGRPTAYVCRDYACDLPVHTPGDLRGRLGS